MQVVPGLGMEVFDSEQPDAKNAQGKELEMSAGACSEAVEGRPRLRPSWARAIHELAACEAAGWFSLGERASALRTTQLPNVLTSGRSHLSSSSLITGCTKLFCLQLWLAEIKILEPVTLERIY
jgi:hypothetical protein